MAVTDLLLIKAVTSQKDNCGAAYVLLCILKKSNLVRGIGASEGERTSKLIKSKQLNANSAITEMYLFNCLQSMCNAL